MLTDTVKKLHLIAIPAFLFQKMKKKILDCKNESKKYKELDQKTTVMNDWFEAGDQTWIDKNIICVDNNFAQNNIAAGKTLNIYPNILIFPLPFEFDIDEIQEFQIKPGRHNIFIILQHRPYSALVNFKAEAGRRHNLRFRKSDRNFHPPEISIWIEDFETKDIISGSKVKYRRRSRD